MNGQGHIYRIVHYLEVEKSPFAVSRLILTSRVGVRDHGPRTPDDPEVLDRVQRALEEMLSPKELGELWAATRVTEREHRSTGSGRF
jgi:hypothetical protein